MIYSVELVQAENGQPQVCRTALRGSEVMGLVEALRRDHPNYLRIDVYFDETQLFVVDQTGQVRSHAA
jgi:hypothetical protein